MPALSPGDQGPDFTLTAAFPDGTEQTLSRADFAGRRLVVFFYPKDDTSG